MPPRTTKRRTTTNLKTKNNQNCQKIKLHGSLTTKELKKKYSFRQAGGADTGSWVERTHGNMAAGQGNSWKSGQSHICMQIKQEEQLGSKTDHTNQGSSMGKQNLKTTEQKNLWGFRCQENSQSQGGLFGETHRLLERTQNHWPRNQHQKGPICLWVLEEMTESQRRAEQGALFPLGPLPHIQHHNVTTWVAQPWWKPKAPPLTT